ncbi:MAG: hypothetical protein R2856_13440 [Caldilineaceae bacterium]
MAVRATGAAAGRRFQGTVATWPSPRSAFSATDTNGFSDVYVHDRDVDGDGVFDEPGAIATIRVSVTSTRGQANSYVEDNRIDISADGRHVAFVSFASNLVSGDTNGIKDIFVHDRDTDTDGVFDEVGAVRTVRVSAGADGAEANGVSYDPSFSGDGRYVAFWSAASNLVPGDTVQCAGSTCQDVFVFDRDADGDGVFDEADDVAIVMASTSTSGQPGDLPSYSPRMAANGRYVTFYSLARNLLGADTVWLNIFVKDLETGAVIHASISENGEPANGNSGLPDISADGNLVVFESQAANLIAGAPSTQSNIYLFNRQGDLPTPTPTVTPTNTPTATSTPTSIPVATPTAQLGAPAWQSTLLDVRGFVGQNADIVLDAAGRPHIAYNSDNIGRGELRYAWWDGFVWHSEVVDTAPSTGEYPSIALTTNGRPRISYFHRDTTALKYAERGDDGTWQTYTVDGSGAGNDRGRFSALTLDPTSGLADIIYYDATAGRLLHVRGAPGLWTYYVVDESSDVGANASLARALMASSVRFTTIAPIDGLATLGGIRPRTWAAIDFDVSGETGHRTALAYDSRGACTSPICLPSTTRSIHSGMPCAPVRVGFPECRLKCDRGRFRSDCRCAGSAGDRLSPGQCECGATQRRRMALGSRRRHRVERRIACHRVRHHQRSRPSRLSGRPLRRLGLRGVGARLARAGSWRGRRSVSGGAQWPPADRLPQRRRTQ